MMTNTQIDGFISRFAGSKVNFYVSKNSLSKNYSATTCCFGKDKTTGEKILVIVLDKSTFKDKKCPPPMLKALLLHEIGHIKMNHFGRKIKKSIAEYEAQMWAISQAIKLKYNIIMKCLIDMFLGWGYLYERKKRLKYYYGAYRKFYKVLGKKNIKMWKKAFNDALKKRIP